MKPIRVVTVLFLLIASTPLYADIHDPGCVNMEKWAMGYNPDDIWQLTPYVRFPAIARDARCRRIYSPSRMQRNTFPRKR